MKKKQTSMQIAYNKQLKRIKKFIARAEKRGYYFDDYKIPNTPKRVSKKALQNITETKATQLYKKAIAVDEQGEIFTGEERRKQERSLASKKGYERKKNKKYSKKQQDIYASFPSESNMVISNFLAEISQFPLNAQPVLTQWVNNIIAQQGKEAVASMLQEGRQNGLIVNWEVAYAEGMLQQYMTEMLDYLPDLGTLEKEQIIDAFEMSEDWSEPL